jgi:hypothetical protein
VHSKHSKCSRLLATSGRAGDCINKLALAGLASSLTAQLTRQLVDLTVWYTGRRLFNVILVAFVALALVHYPERVGPGTGETVAQLPVGLTRRTQCGSSPRHP